MPRFRLFNIHHSTKHVLGPFAHHILTDGHMTSIYPRVAHNYRTRDRSALWISIMGNSSAVKRVVRSEVTRKVRTAFTTALEQAGYSSEGKSLNPQKSNLVGSVTFVDLQFIPILQRQSELDSDMTALVEMLVKTQEGMEDGTKGDSQADSAVANAMPTPSPQQRKPLYGRERINK